MTVEQIKLALQLMQSLEIYKERGEFDGTLNSAIECLTLAGYEIYSTRLKGE